MSKIKIKNGDLVRVITGKDKGKDGKVMKVNHKDNTLIVEGVNMVAKHTKPSAKNQQGGINRVEGPIDVSNVMYLYKDKATRIGYQITDGKKVRIAKSTGDVID